MANIPPSADLQGAAQPGPGQNPSNTAVPPVIIMVSTPALVKEKIPYEQRFPKKFMLALSSIQLAMAILAIITQAMGLSVRHPGSHVAGAGIWCGAFFALSGVFGTIASMKPSFGRIVTFMIFAIISASFSLPLLVFSSIGTAQTIRNDRWCNEGYEVWCIGSTVNQGAFVIQVIISLIQAAAAITSAGMTCKAVCNCCRTRRKSGVVYYNVSSGDNTDNANNQHIVMPKQQPGYITIPINQIQGPAVSVGATAFPTVPVIQDTSEKDGAKNSPPPEYESVAKIKEGGEDANGFKYQKFQ